MATGLKAIFQNSWGDIVKDFVINAAKGRINIKIR
jgi:hypothetical protein